MEHLASDALNIKESLIRMKKFIAGKSINGNKTNDVKDLEGMGKAIWEFIATVYESHWDALHIDNNNTTFRSKVKSKFAPQVKNIQATPIKGKDMVKLTFVSAIPPPIPAKSNKEVKEISKYFKKIDKPIITKLYAQASASNTNHNVTSKNIAMNTLKIKEAFPNLPNKKIDTIQKVVNGINDKPKPRLNMTTKGLSRKQVIVPMNSDLGKRFIKDSANHVTNINRALKSIEFVASILYLKDTWKCLGFIFNRKLTFCQHIKFYTNKALSMVKYMKILGNLIYGLLLYQKCLFYKTCILPIALYGFPL